MLFESVTYLNQINFQLKKNNTMAVPTKKQMDIFNFLCEKFPKFDIELWENAYCIVWYEGQFEYQRTVLKQEDNYLYDVETGRVIPLN